MLPSEEMVSTSSSAGCPAASMALRTSPTAAGDAGGGLVVDDHHGLDRVAGVGGEALLHGLRRDAVAPVAGHEVDLEAELAGHLLPQGGEVAGLEAEDAVTGRERVDERRLPGAGAGRRVDDHRLRRAERRLDRLEHLLAERGERRARGGRSSGGPSPAGPGRGRWSAPGSAGSVGRPCFRPPVAWNRLSSRLRASRARSSLCGRYLPTDGSRDARVHGTRVILDTGQTTPT